MSLAPEQFSYGKIMPFVGPSRVVGRTVRLDTTMEHIGGYGRYYELNKAAELRFDSRERNRRTLNLVRVDPKPILQQESPYLIIASNEALARLRQGLRVQTIARYGLRALTVQNFHPAVGIDKSYGIVHYPDPDDESIVARVGIDMKGRVTIKDTSENGTWVSANWEQLPATTELPADAAPLRTSQEST